MSQAPIDEGLLQAYVDGLLTPVERAEVERYLAAKPAEAERLAGYARQRESIKTAFADVLREPLPERLHAQRFGVGRSALLRVAAVFAWVVLGALLGWTVRGQLDTRPAAAAEPELVERARIAHVIFTAENRRAVEVAASQEDDMIRWLSKRMNAAVRVPKLTEHGYEALGGRLLPGSQGPACQIMYQNAAGKRLTIYLARDVSGAPKPVRFSDKEAVHVVFWSDGKLAFAVSAELDAEALKRIAAEVARASAL